jgi:hypothetical protein
MTFFAIFLLWTLLLLFNDHNYTDLCRLLLVTVFTSKLKEKLSENKMAMSIKQNGALHIHSECFRFLGYFNIFTSQWVSSIIVIPFVRRKNKVILHNLFPTDIYLISWAIYILRAWHIFIYAKECAISWISGRKFTVVWSMRGEMWKNSVDVDNRVLAP